MKLLVAVDGSEEADDALACATDVADAMDASVTVVHVVDPTVYEVAATGPVSTLSDADRQLLVEDVEDAEERGLALLDDAAALAAALDHDVETELLYGNPVDGITDYADEEGFDAIFLGHRGRSERTDLALGSVAKTVVERATVPVTVVR